MAMERRWRECDLARVSDVVDAPPLDFVQELTLQGDPVESRLGIETFGDTDEMDLLVLAIPETVEKDHSVFAGPDVGADLDFGEADFLVEFAA
jgi:hypothetical protein